MDGFKRIVVGVDGSPASKAALAWAVRHAEERVARVTAVSVCQVHPVPSDASPPLGTGPDAFRGMHERLLREAVAGAGPEAEGVEQLVPTGGPGPVLVELSKDADILVLGGHGYHRAGLEVVGSVAAYCLRRAHCPVVIVPVGGKDDDNADGARLSRTAQEFR
ncbi:nucleotide-binding universal stress UspA family protein [Saccharothrix ecbatanensis]|uniref:Nucleotide-binding universal stress UspA family protein n=1 Tax=Saccharothrix ecbatanensis TaxID=1105145 RepID=A0A7W9LZ00_9PSEU|nr:universal stress protein [Saccharothrix ecbatanensis]MBB5801193.1 nucleotide-binding universal stress UspA family protein [Saccharothrix ecbatanensis]